MEFDTNGPIGPTSLMSVSKLRAIWIDLNPLNRKLTDLLIDLLINLLDDL